MNTLACTAYEAKRTDASGGQKMSMLKMASLTCKKNKCCVISCISSSATSSGKNLMRKLRLTGSSLGIGRS